MQYLKIFLACLIAAITQGFAFFNPPDSWFLHNFQNYMDARQDLLFPDEANGTLYSGKGERDIKLIRDKSQSNAVYNIVENNVVLASLTPYRMNRVQGGDQEEFLASHFLFVARLPGVSQEFYFLGNYNDGKLDIAISPFYVGGYSYMSRDRIQFFDREYDVFGMQPSIIHGMNNIISDRQDYIPLLSLNEAGGWEFDPCGAEAIAMGPPEHQLVSILNVFALDQCVAGSYERNSIDGKNYFNPITLVTGQYENTGQFCSISVGMLGIVERTINLRIREYQSNCSVKGDRAVCRGYSWNTCSSESDIDQRTVSPSMMDLAHAQTCGLFEAPLPIEARLRFDPQSCEWRAENLRLWE